MKQKKQTSPDLYVVKDPMGNCIVIVNDIVFKGKRQVKWPDVEEYVRRYIGDFYKITDSKDIIFIDKVTPHKVVSSLVLEVQVLTFSISLESNGTSSI